MPFNKNSIKDKELSIQIFRDGFSFCTHFSRTFFDPKSTPIKNDNAFKKLLEEKSLTGFEKVNCIYFNRPATFVPRPLFDPSKKESYIERNIPVNLDLKIDEDDTLDKKVKVLYQIHREEQEVLKHFYANITFSHYTSVLYNLLSKATENNEGIVMYLHLQDKQFDVMVFDENQLLLFNTYPYKNEEIFLYYVLAVAEELSLKPEAFAVFFLGKYNRYEAYYKALESYHEKLEYIDQGGLVIFDLKHHPSPFFINIFG